MKQRTLEQTQNIRISEHRTATQHESREQFNIRTENIKTFIIRK